jgi:hypothetical protein
MSVCVCVYVCVGDHVDLVVHFDVEEDVEVTDLVL